MNTEERMSEYQYLLNDDIKKPPKKNIKFLPVIGWVCLALLVIIFGVVEVSHYVHQVRIEKKPIGLPGKYAVDNVPPRTFQGEKGTCWEHTAVGLLEHSYRNEGIKKGYLKKEEYVRLSAQAFGDSIVRLCHKFPDTCAGLGSGPLDYNSTDGGEVEWMWYLADMEDNIFPDSICPYKGGKDDPITCDDLDKHRKNNPIKLKMTKLNSAYAVEDAKKLLYEKKESISITIPVHTNLFYIPCVDNEDPSKQRKKSSQLCSLTEKRVPCPSRIYLHDFLDSYNDSTGDIINEQLSCIQVYQPAWNMDGEWYVNDIPQLDEGGHAMQIVGFNDNFHTTNMDKGGFIVKNSWVDQSYPFVPQGGDVENRRGARGSHSIGFWLQTHNNWDEQSICANAENPKYWLSCSDVNTNTNLKNGLRRKMNKMQRNNDSELLEKCTNKTRGLDIVNLTRQPLEFECRFKDKGIYKDLCDIDYRYFLDFIDIDEENEGLVNITLFKVLSSDESQFSKETLQYYPLALIADIFKPIDTQAELLKSSNDDCGFYFIPYESLGKLERHAMQWYTTHIDIDWDKKSYLRNSKKNDTSYEYLRNSTFIQKVKEFDGPLPFIDKRVGDKIPKKGREEI